MSPDRLKNVISNAVCSSKRETKTTVPTEITLNRFSAGKRSPTVSIEPLTAALRTNNSAGFAHNFFHPSVKIVYSGVSPFQ